MMDEFCLHSMFDSLSILRRCQGNTSIPAPKIGTRQMDPKNTKLGFSLKLLLQL
jgi:hypothetical protein